MMICVSSLARPIRWPSQVQELGRCVGSGTHNSCSVTAIGQLQARATAMTDDQFRLLLRHLQVLIAISGIIAGVLIALAWTYL
jgi:hypothetical protein